MARERLRALYAQRKDALKARRADPAVKTNCAAVDRAHREQAKAARTAAREQGLYWGTYLQIEQAAEAASRGVMEPKFRRWTGEGAVSVQLIGGLAEETAREEGDTRLQIDLEARPVPGRGGKPLPRIRLRVGSDEERGPIWAEWPMIYHRPLPAGAVVKWAKVVLRRVAAREEWSVHLVLETAQEAPDAGDRPPGGDDRAVAVDLNWRRPESESTTTRACGWHDGVDTGVLVLPEEIAGELRKADELRSIRDVQVERLRAEIVEWRETLPEAHREQVAEVGLWRAAGRFAALAHWWREHRYEGDAERYARLEGWRARDKHLWLWEAHARQGALRRRRDFYRVFAARLARGGYATLIIERLDLRALAELPVPEAEKETATPQARWQRQVTAPSELRAALVHAFRRAGARIVEVPARGEAVAVWAEWREHGGEARARPGARSNRYKRLHKNKRSVVATAD